MPEKDVLIVDDQLGVRDVLAGILRDNGYEVTTGEAVTRHENGQLLRAGRRYTRVPSWFRDPLCGRVFLGPQIENS
jgi:CheY-like chemotaxis protein